MSKTILMIHGFGAAGNSWTPVAAKFKAAGYAVESPTIHADLRTVAAPPAGLAGKTLSDYVAEMSALAKSIAGRDGEKPLVFGHSMGGLIAQKLAEAGLASGIVLFAPASPADARGPTSLSSVFTFLNIAMTPNPEAKAVKIWRTGFKWGVLNQTPAARHDAIFATTVHDSGRALSDLAYPDRDPNKTVHVDASKVTVPVLVLAGTRDRTTPIGDVRLVAKKYPGSTFKEYPDNAHWLVDEPGSAEILAEVQTWLDAKGLGAEAPAVKAAPALKAPARKAPTTKAAAKPAAVMPEPKGPKTPAKAATPAKAETAKAPAKKPATPKAAPAPKVAKAALAPKPAAKPKAEAKTPAPKPAAKPAPTVKAPAKVAAPKAAPAPKVVKAAPVAKAPAKAAPAPEAASTPKPAAKPKAAAPKTAPKPAKPPAAKSTAKSSPAPKK